MSGKVIQATHRFKYRDLSSRLSKARKCSEMVSIHNEILRLPKRERREFELKWYERSRALYPGAIASLEAALTE